jgi:hypothetical protein
VLAVCQKVTFRFHALQGWNVQQVWVTALRMGLKMCTHMSGAYEEIFIKQEAVLD